MISGFVLAVKPSGVPGIVLYGHKRCRGVCIVFLKVFRGVQFVVFQNFRWAKYFSIHGTGNGRFISIIRLV